MGPDDWFTVQFKQGGTNSMASMDMSAFMGLGVSSPSTGRCHLTPREYIIRLQEVFEVTQWIFNNHSSNLYVFSRLISSNNPDGLWEEDKGSSLLHSDHFQWSLDSSNWLCRRRRRF